MPHAFKTLKPQVMKKKFLLFVGIDISKLTLDVVVGNAASSQHFIFSNDAQGISKLLNQIKSLQTDLSKVLVCCEHTGAYMHKLAVALQSTTITLWAVHPLLLSHYAIELNRFKTDKADAQKMFQYALTNSNKAVPYRLADPSSQMLKELFQLRKQVIAQRSAWLCRKDTIDTKAFCSPVTAGIQLQMLNFLSALVKHLDKEIRLLITSSTKIQSLYHILLSVPGIGPVTAQHLLFVTDGFTRFSNWRALASYIGTAPFPRQSGTSLKLRLRTSKQAYGALKVDLCQGVTSVTRKGQLFYNYYQQMLALNKPHLHILNTIKNMLLKIIFKLVESGTLFDQTIFIQNKKSWNNLVVS
jgi:transposase